MKCILWICTITVLNYFSQVAKGKACSASDGDQQKKGETSACGSNQQQPSSRLRKRKVNEQNKGSRKRVKREVKINLSPREVAFLENGEMLNDTHIDIANQMLRKQFPDVRGL